jgi:hypothetical protein
MVVSASEMIGYTPKCVQKLCADKKNHALLSAASTIQDQHDNHIEMAVVSHESASANQVKQAKELAALQTKLAATEKINSDLALARKKNGKKHGQRAFEKVKKKVGQKKKKNNFGEKRASMKGAGADPFEDEVGAKRTNKNPLYSTVVETVNPSHRRSSSFRSHTSSEGKKYFENIVTKEVTWTTPSSGSTVDGLVI